MLRTRIPRGRGVRRFAFLPLTGSEIEKLESVPTATAGHLDQCSCGRNGGSRLVLEELADLLLVALQHGHELAIEPNADDYALDIEIGASALGAEGSRHEGGHNARIGFLRRPLQASRGMRGVPLHRASAARTRLDPRGHRVEPRKRRATPVGCRRPRGHGHDRERAP